MTMCEIQYCQFARFCLVKYGLCLPAHCLLKCLWLEVEFPERWPQLPDWTPLVPKDAPLTLRHRVPGCTTILWGEGLPIPPLWYHLGECQVQCQAFVCLWHWDSSKGCWETKCTENNGCWGLEGEYIYIIYKLIIIASYTRLICDGLKDLTALHHLLLSNLNISFRIFFLQRAEEVAFWLVAVVKNWKILKNFSKKPCILWFFGFFEDIVHKIIVLLICLS